MFGFANFITDQGLVNLRNYKYNSSKYTYCDNLMQPFWNWFVELIPTVTTLLIIILVGCSQHDHSACPHIPNCKHHAVRALCWLLNFGLSCLQLLLRSFLCSYVPDTRCCRWKASTTHKVIFPSRLVV